ncbi:MAG TPA: hypothetical protein VEX66_15035 [Microlunatus sp.]|nr:hypothetical protein [Microlunatus sp.]
MLYLLQGQSYPIESITGSELYPQLDAVRQDRSFPVSGEMWFGSNPVSVQWVLDDLSATLLDDRAPIPESAAPDRLEQLVTAAGG